jgi:hypothetical protein
MKIAVLVSGSLRTFDHTWPKNEKVLRSLGVDFDFYMHTWEQNLGTYHAVAKGVAPKSFFWRWHPTKFREPENYDPRIYVNSFVESKFQIADFELSVGELAGLSHVKTRGDFQSYLNSSAMYLGMERVAELALNSGVKYTHFLRIRSDFLLNRRFQIPDLDLITMFGDGVLINGTFISDQCFFAPIELIKETMFNYTFLTRKIESEGWFANQHRVFRKAEFVLYENLYDSRLLNRIQKVRKRRFGKIVREVEIRDPSIKLSTHYRGLLNHNKIVVLKVAISNLAKLSRKLHLTKFIKFLTKRDWKA